MKKLVLFFSVMLMGCMSVFAQDSGSSAEPGILSGFASFAGLASIVVPAVVGFISDKLARPMNKMVTLWVTAAIAVAATFFSWWAGLGFPASDASLLTVAINALFVAVASTGIVSAATSQWLAKLFAKK